MSLQDTIADMFTRLRNAQAVGKKNVEVIFSQINLAIAQLLKEEGYIIDCHKSEINGKPSLRIYLKYFQGQPVISHIKRISRPGLRRYVGKQDLPKVLDGLGIAIVSTPKGLMTDKKARAVGQGGEVLCYVY